VHADKHPAEQGLGLEREDFAGGEQHHALEDDLGQTGIQVEGRREHGHGQAHGGQEQIQGVVAVEGFVLAEQDAQADDGGAEHEQMAVEEAGQQGGRPGGVLEFAGEEGDEHAGAEQ